MTGIVKDYEVKTNRDGSQSVLMIKCEISGPDDVQSVEYMSHAGDDHIPPIGSVVTILTAGKSWKIAIASNDQTDFDSSLEEGDRILYSKDKAAFIKILSNGIIEVNGNADNAVSFADLETALNNFKSSIDSAIAGAITGHTHPGVTSGPSSTGTGVGSAPAVTIDISGAKVEDVKLP